MRPRVEYFKFSEAINLIGQFRGISEASRDEKMRLMVALFAEYKLFGLGSVVPHDLFHDVFLRGLNEIEPEYRDPWTSPYVLSFFGLMSTLVHHRHRLNWDSKIDFVFDDQPGQNERVLADWRVFAASADQIAKGLLGDPPIFRNDRLTVALQAADFAAGWLRQMEMAKMQSLVFYPSWHSPYRDLDSLLWVLDRREAKRMASRIRIGVRGSNVGFTYGGLSWEARSSGT